MTIMKRLITILSILACSTALLCGDALAADKPAKKKDCGCCPATVEACKKCEKCACCKEAAAQNKVCTKCHPKAAKPAKKAKKTA